MADPYTEAQKKIDADRAEIIKKVREAGLEDDVLRLINRFSWFAQVRKLEDA